MPVPGHRSRNVVLRPEVEPAEVRALADRFDVNIYPAGWEAALLRLGAGAPVDEDDEFALRIRESVQHKSPEVRRAAVWAMVYTEWAAFRELLQSMAANDPSVDVAEAATRAAKLFAR